jgi:predicted ATPase
VRAGLGLVEAVRELAAEGTPLAVRVGIHTGLVVVGAMGGSERKEALALGGTPNVAARLQASAAPETVVMSGATLCLVPGIFVLEELGTRRFEGISEPVVTWRVVQASGVRSRLEVAGGSLTPFVGRDLELGVLLERWERAEESQGQAVIVLGEPGVGKSRLLYQLRERLAQVPHTWLESRCTPYTQATAFHPVLELLEQGLAFTATDTPPEKLAKLERALGLVGLGGQPDALPILAELLDLPPPERGPSTPTMSPELKRRRTLEVLAAWTLALGALQPAVVLTEDLHWCDPSTLELLGHLVAQSATARMLLVATARPEFAMPWQARSNLLSLQLERLTKRQAREMILALHDGLSREMVDAIAERADGIPLYVEELTKAVVEPGAARGGAIPTTLADSLMARLDRLRTAKEVAQRAAVLGREFPYGLLAAVAGIEEAALRQGLARLVEAEIVFVRGEPPGATYSFKHVLVQEAAYESLLKRARQELHGRIARALRERFPETAEAQPELVAQHHEEAGEAELAAAAWERAGQRAAARSAEAEAVLHYGKALEMLERLPGTPARTVQAIQLNIALGHALTYTHGLFRAAEAFARAQGLGEGLGETPESVLALFGVCVACYGRGELRAAQEVANQTLRAAERVGTTTARVWAHVAQGVTRHFRGDLRGAREHLERAIALYQERPPIPVWWRSPRKPSVCGTSASPIKHASSWRSRCARSPPRRNSPGCSRV